MRGDRGGGRARRAWWRRSRTCCATRPTRGSCGGCSTRARSATSSASSTSSRSASGTRRTPTCAATGAARTRPGRCCWPSAATTSTGSRTWSGAPLRARSPRSAASAACGPSTGPRAPATAAWTARSSGPARTPRARIYLEPAERGETGWPVDVVAWPPTPEHVERGAARRAVRALRVGVRQRRRRPPGRLARLRGRRHREPDDDRVHADARPRDADLRHPRRAARRRRAGRGLRLPDPHHHAPRRPGRRRPDRPRRRRRRRDGRLRRGGGGRRPGARADHARGTRSSRTGSRSRPRPRAARAGPWRSA